MKLLFARSAEHLAPLLPGEKLSYVSRIFSDGERYVRVNEPSPGHVWLVAGTASPPDNLLELFFLMDALRRNGARINLLIPYFAYARQDRVTVPGESVSGAVIAAFIRQLAPERIAVLHMHGERMRQYLDYDDLHPIVLLGGLTRNMDGIVAPDKGAIPFASRLADVYRLPLITTEKKRITDERVSVTVGPADVRGQRLLIVDDMISTGGTVMEVAAQLRAGGASAVTVYATHGIFSANARERLASSAIDRIVVSNSLPQAPWERLEVLDVSPVLREVLR